MSYWWKIWRNWLILSTLCTCLAIQAQPRLAIILGGIGSEQQDAKTLELPLEVALAFLPYSPWGRELALKAWRQERETLLHLPALLTTVDDVNEWRLEPNQDQWQVQYRVRKALADIPFVKGINSELGAAITSSPDHMSWIMEILSRQDLYFVDDDTLSESSAYEQALAWGVTTMERDWFLEPNAGTLAQQWQQILQQASAQGQVLVFSAPNDLVLAFLAQALTRLDQQGIELVALSDLFNQPLLLPTPAQSEPELP